MDPTLTSIFVAVAVALGAWAATQALFGWFKNEKRRLHRRLSSALSNEPRPGEKSILVAHNEATGLSRKLAGRGLFAKLTERLAVVYPGTSLVRFLTICGCIGLTLYVLAFLLTGLPMLGLALGVVGWFAPQMNVGRRANKRQQSFALQLPEAMDFLARILRAGHSLSTGLQMMGTELPEPLAGEFRKCYDQHSLGQPMDDCLKDMASRIQSTDFSFFVTAVLIQRQTGGDLSGVLTNISSMIRGRIRLGQYVKAKTAEGRLTGYILVAFPVIMFFITSALNPKYGQDMLNTSAGLKLLGAAVGLQTIGLFAIRKVTTVKV